MRYDSPNCTVRREHFAGEAGGAATTEYAKFRAFQKFKLKAVHVWPTVAGTATTHKLDVLRGTTSVGSISLSTAAAASAEGAAPSSADLDIDVDQGEQVSVKSGADAAGKAHVVYEFEVLPDAEQS